MMDMVAAISPSLKAPKREMSGFSSMKRFSLLRELYVEQESGESPYGQRDSGN
jgi:hypothetical protein